MVENRWTQQRLCCAAFAVILLAAWISLGSSWHANPQRLLLVVDGEQNSSQVEAAGWCDIPCRDGRTVLKLDAFHNASLEQLLLVSAFGEWGDHCHVRIEVADEADDAPSTCTPSKWQGLPRLPALTPHKPAAPSGQAERLVQLTSADASISWSVNSEMPDRLIEFPKSVRSGWQLDGFEPVLCKAVWSGSRCRIWLPNDEPVDDRLRHWVKQLGELLDLNCIPLVEADQGVWPDVDGDSLVNIVAASRVGRVSPEIHAFVRKADFRTDLAAPWSQNWDVVYVQSGTDLELLRPILIHELTHVAEFSWCRRLMADRPWPVPDWLTEGLAHAAEMRSGAGLKNTLPRLQAFASEPAGAPLVVADALRSGVWRDPCQRGASAAFCHWWTRRHPNWNWPELIQNLEQSEDPWEELTGYSFRELYREWTLHLAACGLASEIQKVPIPVKIEIVSQSKAAQVVLTGTATAYLRVQFPAADDCSHRIRVTADSGSRLQVTVVRMPLLR